MMEGLRELLLGANSATLRMANEEFDAYFSGFS